MGAGCSGSISGSTAAATQPAAAEAPASRPAAAEAPASRPTAAELEAPWPASRPAAAEAPASRPAAAEAPASISRPAAAELPASRPAALTAPAEAHQAETITSGDAPQGESIVVHGIPLQIEPGAASVSTLELARLQSAPPPPAADQPRLADAASGALGRAIYIFISSTFQDMTAERDEIRATVYPRLRALCAKRGVFVHIVDLRWGIRDDEVASGEVVRVCLREVQRSKYFIGILGGRYGWHMNPSAPDDDVNSNLFRLNVQVAAKEFPWATEWIDRSVTELESRAGCLRDVEAARGRALFFFAEGARPDETEGPYAAQRMGELKDEIRRSGLPVQPYRDPQQLATAIRDALVQMVERDYPVEQQQTWLQKERAAQAAFSAVRRRTYTADPRDAAALDKYAAAGSDEIFVLYGEGGSGKSSLVANWMAQWAGGHPRDLTIAHFIGGSQSSSTLSSIARRVGEEVKERWPDAEEVDWRGSDVEVAGRLRSWLAAGARQWKGRVVLALDGLDQLQGAAVAQSLAWLPDAVGPQLRIVLSCIPGPTLNAAKRLPCVATRELVALDDGRRRDLVRWVLQEQGRTLSEGLTERIARSEACGNPLYLRTLLDELSAVAVHATLDAVLDTCLACSSPRDLFRAVLRRLVARHGGVRGGESPVAEAERAVVCSRHGMAESELSGLLRVGTSGGPTEIAWHLLWWDFLPMLVDRDGVFGFFHRCAAEAAQLEFGLSREGGGGALEDVEPQRRAVHGRLGEFFAGQEPSRRRAEEGPWALARAGPAASERLADLLCSRDVLNHNWLDDFEITGLWLRSGRSAEAAGRYAKQLDLHGPDAEEYYLERAAQVLNRMGRATEGIPFLKRSLAILEKALGPNHPSAAVTLHELALLHQARGDYGAALPLYERSLAIEEKALGPDHPSTATTLHNLASLHQARGDYGAALPLYERSLAIKEKALGPDHPHTAATLGCLASLHQDRGDYGAALPLYERSLAIFEKALGPDHPSTAASLHWLGRLHMERGDLATALPLLERSLTVRRAALGKGHDRTAQSATSLGELETAAGAHAAARALLEGALAVREGALGGQHPDTAATLDALGRLEAACGRPREARARLKAALAVRLGRLGDGHPDTRRTAAALAALPRA